MADDPINPEPGDEEPDPPQHSLPAYDEPTPETHRRMTREDEAELALKNTQFEPGTCRLLIILFLLTIALVPAIQFWAELRTVGAISRLPTFQVFKSLPLVPHPADLKRVERTLETDSVVSRWLLPETQFVLTGILRAGNEQVYPGRDKWLFYRPDVDHVIGPPFLDPFRLKRRAQASAIQTDPVEGIIDFRDKLAARGIHLVVLPIPVKPSIEGEKFSKITVREQALTNASFIEFKKRLQDVGIPLFDPTPLLIEQKAKAADNPLYLESDTHWRPETMELVAQGLAKYLDLPTGALQAIALEKEIVGRGDVATMLKLPPSANIYPPEKVAIHQITVGNSLWRPDRNASILLLGDSFSNVYSLEGMGWGESAGFAEHLSAALHQPIDCILRNSDAAFATREILSKELNRGQIGRAHV